MPDLPQHPTPEPTPAPTCGATTNGMYGRLLGPCLNQQGHPDGTLHRDAEWLEYDHTSEEGRTDA